MGNGGATGGTEIEVMAAEQQPVTVRNTMNRIAALAVTAAATCATLAVIAGGASAATTPATVTAAKTTTVAAPAGIGAVLWAGSDRITVAPGTSQTVQVAFYSTGPAETATVSASVASPAAPNATFARTAVTSYIHLSASTVTLPAKPAAPVTLTHIPNGAGGFENLTTPNAYVFVAVTITVPANAAAYTYSTGNAYETITGQVQVTPAAGITTSPGAGIALALSTH
jgi:hypothetical protein